MDERRFETCPPFSELIRAHERELPDGVCATIAAHARNCVPCQARLRQVEAVIHAAGAALLSDVAIDAASRARAARFAQKLHTRKQTRIHRPARRPMQRWLSVAAMLPLLVVGFMLSRPNTTILHADELLARAATQARQRPAAGSSAMQRVRITLRPALRAASDSGTRYAPFLAVRELTNGTSTQAWPSVNAAVATDESMARLLETHHFDWREPLSVDHFLSWRATLTDRRDRVSLPNDAEFVLRTSTTEGVLREVHLTLDRSTFRVVRQLLVFEGIGSLEIEEIAEWVRRDQPVLLARAAETAAHVESISVRVPAPAAATAERLDAAHGAGLAGWLDRTFGPGATPVKATFVPEVRRLVGDASRQINALYALAPRPSDAAIWGEPQEPAGGDLSDSATDAPAADSAQQAALVEARYREVNATLTQLSQRMAVMFGSTSRCASREHPPADWSSRAAVGLDRSRRFERAMQGVLALSDLTEDERSSDGARQTSRAFDALWDALNCGPVHN